MLNKKYKIAFSFPDIIILLLLGSVNLSLSMDKQALSVVAPVLQDHFSLSLVQLTVVISAMSWAYGFAQLPAGWLTEKIGARMMLVLATAGWGVVTLLTPMASGFASLIVLRLLLGVSQAPDFVASIYVVAKRFPESRRATATSILLSSLYLGLVIGGPLSLWLLEHYGWEASFYVYGWIGILLAVACFFSPSLNHDHAGAAAIGKQAHRQRPPYREMVRSPQFWAIGFIYYAMVTIFGFFWGMLPIYLKQARNIDLQDMSWLISLPYVFLWAGVLLSGRLSDFILQRSGSKWYARIPLGAGGMLVGGIGLAGMLLVQSDVLLGCCLSLSLLGVGFVSNTTWSVVQDIGSKFAGLLSGWVSFCGHMASSTALIAVSLLVQRTGSWDLALLLPIVIVVAGVFAWFIVSPQTEIGQEAAAS